MTLVVQRSERTLIKPGDSKKGEALISVVSREESVSAMNALSIREDRGSSKKDLGCVPVE